MSGSNSLIDAILAFINEPNWSMRKQIVECQGDLLLGNEIDSVLEAAVANNVSRPAVQERFQECRKVLADCRAIGVDAAFALWIGPAPGLMEALQDLLASDSAAEAHEITVRHQSILLTQEADWFLAALAHEGSQETSLVERIAHHREWLGRCRTDGIESAFAEILHEEKAIAALQALFQAIGSAEEVGIVLKRYEDVLLTDRAAILVGKMVAKPDLSPEVTRIIDAVSKLLEIARMDGVSTASATYLLPPFEQFINRCFFALAKGGDRDPGRRFGIVELLQAEFDKVGNKFPDKLREWCQAVLEKATQEGLGTYIRAVSHLGRALKESPTAGSETLRKEAATACFQAENRLSQRACVLRQEKARIEQTFASVEEAVATAMRMKAEGGFDLFRGQRCCWPVVSSFRRLDAERQAEARTIMNEFINWAKTESALRQYGFSSDQAIAIAQHYGIATSFLDFSSDIEVAQYFATEHCFESASQDPAEKSELSCIVAVRSAHLDDWAKKNFRQTDEFLGPQILRLNVPNLWRIEAQAGAFLVDDEILDTYPFHYLLFPASISPEYQRARATVYPEKRSDLELVLDQWFWHKKASTGTRYFQELLNRSGVFPHGLTLEETDGIGLKGVLRPEPHPSWSGRDRVWLRATEHLEEVLPHSGETLQVELWPGMGADAVRSLIGTLLPLDSLTDRRKRSADWRVLVDGSPDLEAAESLARQWDALRIDGYSNEQVAASFTSSILLAAFRRGLIADWPGYGGSLGIGDDIGPLTSFFGYDMLVEFAGLVGYSRAVVNAADLRSAVRDDIDRYLPSDLYDGCGTTPAEQMHQLLIGIHRPGLLFDFTRFADIYVRQVVPTSVIFRPKLPLYPVLHLRTFGVP